MAVSHDDRISSARLKDFLNTAQEKRMLGKEPEVETTTEVLPAVVSPAPGTYQNNSEYIPVLNITPDASRLPFKVYIDTTYENIANPYPINVSEPNGDYIELTQHINGMYVEANADINNPEYTGFILQNNNGLWLCMRTDNSNEYYQWEMPEKTVATTTTTKHPVAQKYLPNADWNVNDPTADGYVENKTHWVEKSVVDVEPVSQSGGMAVMPSYSKPTGFAFVDGSNVTGEYYPEFEAVETTYAGLPCWVLGEDENGNQYTSVDPEDIHYTSIVLVDGSTIQPDYYVALVTYQGQGVTLETVRAEGEVVHKLDRKFYDYTEPYSPPDFRHENGTEELGVAYGRNYAPNTINLKIKLHASESGVNSIKVFSFDDITASSSSYPNGYGNIIIKALRNKYNNLYENVTTYNSNIIPRILEDLEKRVELSSVFNATYAEDECDRSVLSESGERLHLANFFGRNLVLTASGEQDELRGYIFAIEDLDGTAISWNTVYLQVRFNLQNELLTYASAANDKFLPDGFTLQTTIGNFYITPVGFPDQLNHNKYLLHITTNVSLSANNSTVTDFDDFRRFVAVYQTSTIPTQLSEWLTQHVALGHITFNNIFDDTASGKITNNTMSVQISTANNELVVTVKWYTTDKTIQSATVTEEFMLLS